MADQSIWKFELPVEDEVSVEMPRGSRVLSVGVQGVRIFLWALCPTGRVPKEVRRFAIRGTGHPADGVSRNGFIGTVMLHGDALVFHVFERQEVPRGPKEGA